MSMKYLGVLAIASILFAQEKAPPAKVKPPEGSAPRPFKVPPRQTWTLENGLRISAVSYGRIPKIVVRAFVRAGNVNEGPNEIWLADLTGEMMKEGAGSRTAAQLAEAASLMGGQLTVSVGSDQTTVDLEVLSEFAADAIQLVGDVLQRPMFPESELPRLRNDMVRRLAVVKSQPQAISDELFYKAIYPNHPYGRLFPTEEMIKAYTLEQVRSFYRKSFGAQRTSLYVAGMFDLTVVRKAVNGAFTGWTRGDPPANNVPQTAGLRSLHTADRPNATQSTVRIGLPVPHPAHKDYVALEVTDSMLGGSFISRITSNIREQKGYTYSPRSATSAHYRDAFWVHRSDVTTASTGAAMTEIFNEINRLRREPPSDQELKGFQQSLAGIFVMQNSSPSGIIGRLNFVDLHGLGDSWLSTYVQNVNALKPSDVQRIAETYLDPNKMTITVVGDQSKISDQIEPFRRKPAE